MVLHFYNARRSRLRINGQYTCFISMTNAKAKDDLTQESATSTEKKTT